MLNIRLLCAITFYCYRVIKVVMVQVLIVIVEGLIFMVERLVVMVEIS